MQIARLPYIPMGAIPAIQIVLTATHSAHAESAESHLDKEHSMTTQHGKKPGISGRPTFIGTFDPQRKQYSSLDEVKATFPGLRVPSTLPKDAKFVTAFWSYPPKVTTKLVNGRLQKDAVDTNPPPSLTWGHVQLVFSLTAGSLIIDQGPFTPFLGLENQQFGPANVRTLPSGRTIRSRDMSGPGLPPEGVRVAGWIDSNGYKLAAVGFRKALTVDELAAIADSA
jgi:hypothetical protein